MTDAAERNRRSLAVELALVTAAVLVACRLLMTLRGMVVGPWFIADFLTTSIYIVLLYVPIEVMLRRGRPIDFVDRSLNRFLFSAALFLVAAAVIFPPFVAVTHLWQLAMGKRFAGVAAFPAFPFVAWTLLIVAPVEEFYFRGYFQSAMNGIFERRWRFLGAYVGWGLIVTAAVFAFAHSVIFFRWWHFSIFFPALVFGYLRERTGSITAPTLFHAASNILMDWIARSYIPA